ncbi:MAG: hypothetical protein LAN18_02585 [Acidobacteriia bacterium]|nr:hypothetical protein [Terriglobia bacterium]
MNINKKRSTLLRRIIRSALIAGFCLSAVLAFAAQNQQDQSNVTVQQPYSGAAPEAPRQDAPPQFQAAPPTLTLPAGTTISVRNSGWLSSDQNRPGDTFSAVLDQPLVVDGWVVARRGQAVLGRVDMALKASHNSGVSQLGLSLAEITIVDGQQLPVQTQLVQTSTGPSNQKVAGTVATTTVLGTVIGGIAGGGTGAAIGAIAGAGGGMAVAMSTRGRPTVIFPETLLSFRLNVPAAISTERSQVAFQPVSQEDYDRPPADRGANHQRPMGSYPPYPAPYYYPYPYYNPYWYGPGYPGFYLGFGGYYGFGRGYYGGFRGRGFRR